MHSIDSKFHSCKTPVQSITHFPLQIRTNKHRCFVFCLGHTSLTCVPGIGKKNQYLLNQSGIHDLSGLYRKYRSINNMQRFEQWLEKKIGFTSYQAKMTACGIGSKLGEIKEVNTRLTSICCPLKEQKRRLLSMDEKIQSDKEEIKKRKTENVKEEKLSPSSNRDERVSNTIEFLVLQWKSNGKETKFSPNTDDTLSSSTEKLPHKLSNHYPTGVKSPDGSRFTARSPSMNKSDLSSSPNEHSFEQVYDADEVSKTKLSRIPSSTSAQLKKEPFELTRSPSTSAFKKNADVYEIGQESSLEDKRVGLNSSLDKFPNEKHLSKDEITRSLSPKTEKLNEIFSLTKQKLQPTFEALQDKRGELLSASKHPPDSLTEDVHSKRSIPYGAQSKPTSPINTTSPIATVRQKHQQQDAGHEIWKMTALLDTDRNKTVINNDTDSDQKLSTDNDNKSIFSTEPSHSSTLFTTPVGHSTKSKFQNETDLSDTTKWAPETALKSEIDRSISPVTLPGSNLTSSRSRNKWQESTPNRSAPSWAKSEQGKLQKEINKTVNEIMGQASHIVHNTPQQSLINSTSSTKAKSRRSSSSQIPIADTVQSITSISMKANNKDDQSLHLSDQESSTKNVVPFDTDRLKQTSTDTSSEQAQQELYNTSPIAVPGDTVINNPKLPSNTSEEVPNDQDWNAHSKTKLLISMNKFPEALKLKSSRENKSLSTLSSLSNSNQSINRTPSTIKKIQSTSDDIKRFTEETEMKTNHDVETVDGTTMLPSSREKHDHSVSTDPVANESVRRSLTGLSPNFVRLPTEHGEQSLSTSITLLDSQNKQTPDDSVMPSNSLNQLSYLQTLKDDQLTNKNPSEITNSKENSESQSRASPLSPIPCHALWENVSNETILYQRRKHRFTRLNKVPPDQKINQRSRNQNHPSYTTLFTYFGRQNYSKEPTILDDHILYMKHLKTVFKQEE